MAKPRDNRHKDLLRPALAEVIDLGHPLVRMAGEIDWEFLDRRFSSVCKSGGGRPPLPSRLVAGLILKPMHTLSDEALCARWLENPYYQFFCGKLSYCHRLPAVRPLVADALAAAAGRGTASGVAASWIYFLVLVIMVVGFALIGVGIWHVYGSPKTFGASIVAAVSGVVVQFIGATFLLIYKSTMAQARDYVLERINAVGMSIQILESIEGTEPKMRNDARSQ